ncbi:MULTISPECIES: 3-dehydroquinate synthase II [Pontibacillus]|uniref:3-dehydroquinate synthase II n=1 Tax=Pontibacillus chungwhensis TaxID=265426 RepID=A0ABY8UX21_9BACI|nr:MULTISPECIES: 3-dehydroquinate synthase II [Pontibacillus]MCD5324205.1 3-dehydroquinate synthase [Pontibacillus sp. HN14]WIF97738.1 3-dehydroquinate synthase II [Pontibacillus chungwhensis]
MQKQTAYYKVTKIVEVGEGMRVCLDFADILAPSEGLFVGNTGHGYVHILSENRETGDYPARPFRINCGAFHQYLHQGDRTLYLHEINPGEAIKLFDLEEERERYVGRVKIEKRPFIRVECETGDGTISATLQNSSSVFIREESEGELSVQDLAVGHRILCLPDQPGRHLGERIEGTIFER